MLCPSGDEEYKGEKEPSQERSVQLKIHSISSHTKRTVVWGGTMVGMTSPAWRKGGSGIDWIR